MERLQSVEVVDVHLENFVLVVLVEVVLERTTLQVILLE